MLCALTVRRLKPGTFDQFAERFGPPPEGGEMEGWVRFHMVRGVANPDEVVTFGFYDGTLEQMEASQKRHGYAERVATVDDLVEEVVSNGVYDMVKVMELAPAGTP